MEQSAHHVFNQDEGKFSKIKKSNKNLVKTEKKKDTMHDLEPICIILAKKDLEAPDKIETGNAVMSLISDFRIIGTLDPLIHLFIGRWRPEITEDTEDRTTRLVDHLKSIKATSSVKVCHGWTDVLKQHELAWKDWRETY